MTDIPAGVATVPRPHIMEPGAELEELDASRKGELPMASRVYELRDVPQDVFDSARARAEREGWTLPAVIVQMMREYGAGELSPSGGPPPDPLVEKWWPIFENVYRQLAASSRWKFVPDQDRAHTLKTWSREQSGNSPLLEQIPRDFDFTLLARRFRLAESRLLKTTV